MAKTRGDAGTAPLWGVSAEFETAEAMVAALEVLRPHDLGRLDAFSPVPIPEAGEVLRLGRQPIHPYAILGAVIGGLLMFAMCTYATIWGYRFNIGGRPLFSWPAFIVPSVSFAMLCGSVTAYLMLFILNRLPRLNHPAFNIPDFTRVTKDRFFLAVEAQNHRQFDPDLVEQILAGLATPPDRVARVAR